MDVARPPAGCGASLKNHHSLHQCNRNPLLKPSHALPLPLYIINGVFFTLFFSLSYFLLQIWKQKIVNSTPLLVITLPEIVAFVYLIVSAIYLIGFFGTVTDIVQNLLSRSSQKLDKFTIVRNRIDCSTSAAKPTAIPKRAPELVTGHFSKEDESLIETVVYGKTPSYSLETKLGDCWRAARIRREALQRTTGRCLDGLPLEGFDYESILGQCCEMPVGYVQMPLGVVGPLLLDGKEYMVPMATTEGCLVASTNRGCKAMYASGGATSTMLSDAMTRAPIVRFPTAEKAARLKLFLEDPLNFDSLAVVFNRSSRFARLKGIKCATAGRNVYIRFSCNTGDAMGMKMVTKAVQNVLHFLHSDFPEMDVVDISGNFCSDKRPAGVNWIQGRGKSVVCEAIIRQEVVVRVLKTSVAALVELNMLKNLTGSAVAGALGGFNAHASNIVCAIFIATGQDPAQNVESSHCITMMEAVNHGQDLHISVSMPCIEVGTVGGGTQLASQSACLNLLGVKGANKEAPGSNSRFLATIVAGSVLAGELSLMSAIAAGQLVNSHLKYNRSTNDVSKQNKYQPEP